MRWISPLIISFIFISALPVVSAGYQQYTTTDAGCWTVNGIFYHSQPLAFPQFTLHAGEFAYLQTTPGTQIYDCPAIQCVTLNYYRSTCTLLGQVESSALTDLTSLLSMGGHSLQLVNLASQIPSATLYVADSTFSFSINQTTKITLQNAKLSQIIDVDGIGTCAIALPFDNARPDAPGFPISFNSTHAFWNCSWFQSPYVVIWQLPSPNYSVSFESLPGEFNTLDAQQINATLAASNPTLIPYLVNFQLPFDFSGAIEIKPNSTNRTSQVLFRSLLSHSQENNCNVSLYQSNCSSHITVSSQASFPLHVTASAGFPEQCNEKEHVTIDGRADFTLSCTLPLNSSPLVIFQNGSSKQQEFTIDANVTNPFSFPANFSPRYVLEDGTELSLNYSVMLAPGEIKHFADILNGDLIQEKLSSGEESDSLTLTALVDSTISNLQVYFPAKITEAQYVSASSPDSTSQLLPSSCNSCSENETLFIVPSLPSVIIYFKPTLAAAGPVSTGSSQKSTALGGAAMGGDALLDIETVISSSDEPVSSMPSDANSFTNDESTSAELPSSALTGQVVAASPSLAIFLTNWLTPLVLVLVLIAFLISQLNNLLVLKVTRGKNCAVIIFNHATTSTQGTLREFVTSHVSLSGMQSETNSIIGRQIAVPLLLSAFSLKIYRHSSPVLARAMFEINSPRKKTTSILLRL